MQFIEQANKHHPTIKLTAEISDAKTTFLDTNIYEGESFKRNSVRHALQTYWNISMNARLVVARTGSQKRLYQRLWDFSEQTLLKNIWKAHLEF